MDPLIAGKVQSFREETPMASARTQLDQLDTAEGSPAATNEGPAAHSVPVGIDAPIFEVMASMPAMRRLRPDPVTEELLRQLIEAASWAPNANHLQRYSFVVVTDRDQMARLAAIWRSVVGFYRETFLSPPRPDVEPDLWRRTLEAVDYQAAHFADTPALIVACYDFGTYPSAVRGRMLRAPGAFRRFGARRTLAMFRNLGTLTNRTEAASIYPAVQNLLLAARSLGLAANLTTWHLMAEGEVKQALGIPRGVHTYALIPVGWPVGKFGRVRRHPVELMIHRDRW
jgi:nitroreductase